MRPWEGGVRRSIISPKERILSFIISPLFVLDGIYALFAKLKKCHGYQQRFAAFSVKHRTEKCAEPVAESVAEGLEAVDAGMNASANPKRAAAVNLHCVVEIDADILIGDEVIVGGKLGSLEGLDAVFTLRSGGIFLQKVSELTGIELGGEIEIHIGLAALKKVTGYAEEVVLYGKSVIVFGDETEIILNGLFYYALKLLVCGEGGGLYCFVVSKVKVGYFKGEGNGLGKFIFPCGLFVVALFNKNISIAGKDKTVYTDLITENGFVEGRYLVAVFIDISDGQSVVELIVHTAVCDEHMEVHTALGVQREDVLVGIKEEIVEANCAIVGARRAFVGGKKLERVLHNEIGKLMSLLAVVKNDFCVAAYVGENVQRGEE